MVERTKRKGKATQCQKRWHMETELPKTSTQAWKHCPRTLCILQRHMGRLFVSHFFKAPQWGDISWNCSYLYIHSLLFQSMINRLKSLVKGGVDFVLLSLSTSPHPTPPFYALPQLLDSSVPLTPACFGQSHRAVMWVRGGGVMYLLVDNVPLFIFQYVSCCWCPHVLPLCISRKMDFVLVLLPFIFLL